MRSFKYDKTGAGKPGVRSGLRVNNYIVDSKTTFRNKKRLWNKLISQQNNK
jgi:hypothetical protein